MQETTIEVAELNEFKFGANKEKSGWNITATDGRKFATFSSTHAALIPPQGAVKLKFVEAERGGYKNLDIKAVHDGTDWVESSKPAGGGGGGGRVAHADPVKLQQEKELEIAKNQSIQRQVALKTVVELIVHDKLGLADLDSQWQKHMKLLINKEFKG